MTLPKLFDRVKDTTSAPGTGTATLANSAPSGFQTFATAGASNGDYVKYAIVAQSGGKFEVGFGVYNSSGPSITRVAAQVEAGSAGVGVLENFSGTCDVLCVDTAASHGGNAIYGDFSDGALTFDGSSIVASITPSGNVYTLGQHLYSTVIIVNSGVTIKTNGYGIWGLLLINNGAITATGTNASGGSQGLAQWLGSNRPLAPGVDGLVGKTVSSAGGQPSALTNSYGGSGGSGGAVSGGNAAGGSGGVNIPNTTNGASRHYPFRILGSFITRASSTVINMNCGNGGGSGAFNTGTSSGAGGAGTGQLVLCIKIIVNNGTISANGSDGGNATGSGNAAGGGGGGGGEVDAIYNIYIGANPTVAGGNPGNGIGTGLQGSVGGSGRIFMISNS